MNANYQQYWQLLGNGTVQNGSFTLNPNGVSNYSAKRPRFSERHHHPDDRPGLELCQRVLPADSGVLRREPPGRLDGPAGLRGLQPPLQLSGNANQVAALTRNSTLTEDD